MKIIKGKFDGFWETYGEVKTKDDKLAKIWFEEFEV